MASSCPQSVSPHTEGNAAVIRRNWTILTLALLHVAVGGSAFAAEFDLTDNATILFFDTIIRSTGNGRGSKRQKKIATYDPETRTLEFTDGLQNMDMLLSYSYRKQDDGPSANSMEANVAFNGKTSWFISSDDKLITRARTFGNGDGGSFFTVLGENNQAKTISFKSSRIERALLNINVANDPFYDQQPFTVIPGKTELVLTAATGPSTYQNMHIPKLVHIDNDPEVPLRLAISPRGPETERDNWFPVDQVQIKENGSAIAIGDTLFHFENGFPNILGLSLLDRKQRYTYEAIGPMQEIFMPKPAQRQAVPANARPDDIYISGFIRSKLKIMNSNI